MVKMIPGSVAERASDPVSGPGTAVPVAVRTGPRRPVETARFLSERDMNECPFILLAVGEGPAEFAERESRRHPSRAPAAGFFASLMNECTFTSTRPWRDSAAARSGAVRAWAG
jgi:hypothetical protein